MGGRDLDALTIILFVLGLGLLIGGAELLVRGASSLAEMVGISPLIVGLTVVAFGTSSPELAVSVKAGLGGQGDIAVGNVIGSNIFNVLLILGLSAMIVPLAVSRQLIRLDVPVMVAVSVVALVMMLDGRVSALDGAILVIGLVVYVGWLVRMGLREQAKDLLDASTTPALATPAPATPAPVTPAPTPVRRSAKQIVIMVTLVLVGLGLLVLGARWLVDGAVAMARSLGVSELVIGLTIIAAGTSLPEVATSLMASVRGQRDIAVGNVVGSNIFNILGILGISSIVAPGGLMAGEQIIWLDGPVMLAVAVACVPVFFTGGTIARWEGAVFLFYYAAYTAYLILDAYDHAAFGAYQLAMAAFVIPLTVITLSVTLAGHWRQRGTPDAGLPSSSSAQAI